MRPSSRLSKRQSKSFARQQRDRRIWKWGLLVVALLAWIFVLSRLTWLGFLMITDVQVYGTNPTTATQIRSLALKDLDGSYIGLFSRANTLLYPKHDIIRDVMNAEPQLLTMTVYRTSLKSLAINVTEKLPAAVVCAELPDFSDVEVQSDSAPVDPNSPCYFADASGFLFAPAPEFSGDMYRRYYEPDLANNASSSPLGSYATSTKGFMSLEDFYDQVKTGGINTMGILMKGGGEYELYAVNAGQNASSTSPDIAVIYFNDLQPLSGELSDLLSFWNRMQHDPKNGTTSVRFESVDVRYGPNVFYRIEK